MPKHTLIAPYDKFHGAVKDVLQSSGFVLFSSPKAGNVSRRYVVPDNPESTNQTAWRNILTQAAQGYQALTAAQAEQWNAAAEALEETDILGQTYELSGIGLYVRLNSYRVANGQAQVDTPPTITPPSGTFTLSAITYISGLPGLTIDVTTSGLADGTIILARVARDLGSEVRQARDNEFRCQSTALTNCFATVTANVASWSLTVGTPSATGPERVGVDLQSLSSNYVPGSSQQFRNTLMSYS